MSSPLSENGQRKSWIEDRAPVWTTFAFLLGFLVGICVVILYYSRASNEMLINASVYSNHAPFERVNRDFDYHNTLIRIIHGASRTARNTSRPTQFTSEEVFHVLMCERFDWNTFLDGSAVYSQMLSPYSTLFGGSHGLSHQDVVGLMNSFHELLKQGKMVDAWEYCVAFRKRNHSRHPPAWKPSIAVLMVGIGYETHEDAQASIRNKRMYAERHGYAMVVLDHAPEGGTRHPAWYKYSLALQMLSDHEYVWIIDVDTMITNMDQKLEDIINPAYHMIVGVDPNGSSNTGSVIIRSTDWSKLFLMYLWSIDNGERSGVVWDQSAFEHAISSRILTLNPHRADESMRLASHIMFVGQDVFNADNIQLLDHVPFVINFHAKAAGLRSMKQLTDLVSSTFFAT